MVKKPTSVRLSRMCVTIVTCIVIVVLVITIVLAVTLTKFPRNSVSESDIFAIVETSCLDIEGKEHRVKTDEGEQKKVYEFRNIPYALPPTGRRRWRPPVPLNEAGCDKKPLLKYSKETVVCKQIFRKEVVGREDCLILTVRTPIVPTEKNNQILPVFFWIHGGGLYYGSSYWPGYFPNEQFSASINVVSVSINYRLNVFGFLSLEELWINSGSEESYGNYGILDQILALKWVRKNIKQFGGDPDRISIFGESGGGKAVFDLISSPRAKGLFRKAISSSGYPIALNVTKEYANERFRIFLNDTQCNKTSAADVVDCLQAIDDDIIVNNLPWFKHPDPNQYVWEFPKNKPSHDFPVDIIDNVVIPAPIGFISEPSNERLDILVGSMAQEGSVEPQANTWNGLDQFLKPRVDSFKPGIYNKLLSMYKEKRGDKVSPEIITSQYLYTIMSSDVLLSCQTNDISKHLATLPNTTLYRYVVSQTQTESTDGEVPTAYHGIDTVALFGNKDYDYIRKPTNDDRRLMMNLRRMFKQFIYSELSSSYINKTMDFWNNTIVTWDHPYHEKECKVLRDNGFLKKSWGQIGV